MKVPSPLAIGGPRNSPQALNDSLAAELVCVLRYRRHHFMARGIHSHGAAQEFLQHSNEEQGHADQIAERIVQRGGAPDFANRTKKDVDWAVVVFSLRCIEALDVYPAPLSASSTTH